MPRAMRVLVFLAALGPAAAVAQGPATQPNILRRLVTVNSQDAGGLGASVLANVGAFYGNGDYNAFSAGTGFGVSWKAPSATVDKYPFEAGIYVAPQVSGTGTETSGSISLINHYTLWNAVGIGAGLRFWEKGTGFVGANKQRVFLTLGYNITNKK